MLAVADAPHAYDGVAEHVVRALKYGRWRSVAIPMAEAMRPTCRALAARIGGEEGCVLVPVPATPARLRERGFNQARVLTDALAADLGLAVEEVLIREAGGGRQAAAGVSTRRANVLGRFRATAERRVPRGALIVDDVLTTGATVCACANALAEAGFARIGALTFARTLRNA